MGSVTNEPHCDSQKKRQDDGDIDDGLFRRNSFLPSLVEHQARLRPARVCLASSVATCSFARLWGLVEVNAIRFSKQGVTQDSRVAIVSESSAAAIVALLAILRVGAVAIPLNHSLPESRLQSIAQACRLTHLIALTAHSQQVNLAEVDRLTLDLKLRVLKTLVKPNILPEADPQAPAVVIFTSGSSGEPKGVVHSHASLSTMALAVGKSLHINPQERNFLFPSFGWAVNIIDTFSTLAAGACLCIPTETEKSQGLEDVIRRLNATRTTLPPSVLDIMEPGSAPSLTSVVLAGEPMRPDLVLTWSCHLMVYWNYGSSETLMVLAGKAAERDSDAVNAGHALPSCRCYIVDENEVEVPPGGAGQLIIEGHTNFIGYFQDGRVCEAERGPSGCVVVRSGDLFEQDKRNAALIHRGRLDSRLKIAGQRFAPQEVENALRSALMGVKELAVTVATLKDNATGPALVVVVVLKHTDSVSESPQARLDCSFESLVQKLSPYMIPIGALQADRLPRLHNGKLDRKGVIRFVEQRSITELIDLRAPHEDQARDHDLTLTETFARVWAKVLGVNSVNPKDITSSSSFFLLGGNSLLAMRACKELRQLKILMSISDFFLHPKLGQMVQFIAQRDKARPDEIESLPHNGAYVSDTAASELYEMAAEQCGVDVRMIEDVYPCTPLQAGLMTLSEIQEGAYVAEHKFRLPKTWSRAAFIDVWLRVLKATPILRSRIVRHQNGRLYNATMAMDTCSALPGDSSLDASPMACGSQLFLHWLVMDQHEFDLTWCWRVHHSVYDRWSTNLILDMVRNEHNQVRRICSPPFSLFALAVTQQEGSGEARDFWRSRLESFTGSVFPQLPLDHQICRVSNLIAFEASIKRRRSATTQATSIQGALALLISRMHGESDVVFGMTVHGRASSRFAEPEKVIGPTIATVPVRTQLDGSLHVHKFLEQVQAQAALMSDYEHFGLQNMKSIGPGSASAASFTTLLIVQVDLEHDGDRGLDHIVEIDTGSSDSSLDYALVVECFPHATGIKVKLLYDPAVHSEWEVQMMAEQFEQLLDQLECHADPSTAIKDLKLLGSAGSADILRMSYGTLREIRECLHERIFAKSEAWKTDDALHGFDAKYTYAELEATVLGLTSCLSQSLGCSSGRIVPLCFPKSAAAVVAMLAILSAGHAFLLIDPALPIQRIQYMVDAVEATHIVCSSETICHVQSSVAQTINFEDIMNAPSQALACLGNVSSSSPEAPAYCIFTSGSTGSPKGVLLLHKQVTSGLEAQCEVGLYRPKTRLLQFSSYSFDTCIADIFATLLSGGCVCVPRDEERLTRISENINEFSATVIDLTPSVARMIEPDDVLHLEVLRLGGEAMHHHHIRKWASRCNLQNTYGPTECCVQCLFVDHVEDTMSPSVIGKGIGCNTWVVDPQNYNYLMPLGAVGELAIQGPAVASGYINNQEKSRASFLTQAPWLATYGIGCDFPVYLTGDLVKFGEGGNLVFLSRRDNQIKIRGQRVELEEIEHVLQQDILTDLAVVCYPSTGIACISSRRHPRAILPQPVFFLINNFAARTHHRLDKNKRQ